MAIYESRHQPWTRPSPVGTVRRHHDITAAGHDHIVEHGFAHLKTWRILTELRTSPVRVTDLLRALLVLTNLELDR